MVKRQRNGTWVLFVIFGLAAVVALFMFSGNHSGLTGNVVVGEVTCDGTWTCGEWTACAESLQTRTCESTDTTNCVGSSPVTESQACVMSVCDAAHLNLCDATTCTSEIGFWYNEVCNAVAQPVCDVAHLNLCDATTCTSEIGFWYNSLCNAVAQPVACAEDWSCEAWDCSDAGVKSRVCTDVNACGTTNERPSISGSCNPETFGTTTTTPTTTPITTQTTTTITVCSPSQESCANGALYTCNAEGSGWDLTQACELGCAGNTCAVPVQEQAPAETCEDGVKNQNEVGVDCGGVCSKRCSIFTLAGSVVQGPAESTKQFFTNLFSNKTRMYLILGGIGVLVAGFVSYLCFFKKRKKKK